MQPLPVEQLALLEVVEQWRPLPEAPVYQVSSHGRIRRGEHEVASWPNAKGYRLVNLEIAGSPKLRYVHRLVLSAFTGPANGRLANHLSGRKAENTVDNLEWTTPKGNTAHARALGLIPPPQPSPRDTCRFGHPRDQRYHQRGRPYSRCSRCRRAAYSRQKSVRLGQTRSLLTLLE